MCILTLLSTHLSSNQNRWSQSLGGGLFLQLVQLGVVAPMNVPSGVSRAEHSVIIPTVAYRPKAQIITRLGAGSNGCSSIAGGAKAKYRGVR